MPTQPSIEAFLESLSPEQRGIYAQLAEQSAQELQAALAALAAVTSTVFRHMDQAHSALTRFAPLRNADAEDRS